MRLPVRSPFPLLLLLAGCQLAGGDPAGAPSGAAPEVGDTTFARLVRGLSEQGGYFDTDNLISNERSYLHVNGALRARALAGGAYLGVGPDQNFAYIVETRPEVAFILDLRRDNLLLHLLLKALFQRAATRVEYLSLLHGRVPPPDPAAWSSRDLEELVGWVERAPRQDAATWQGITAELEASLVGFGVPLSPEDLAKIRRFHAEFVDEGLGLRFRTFGRSPQPYYPSYRDLLLERDLEGVRAGYLAREEGYGFLRDLQRAHRVIPVVGDFAGEHALPAIAAWLREHDLAVTVFYTSNVEFYLFGDGTFRRFAGNVALLPRHPEGVLVRSYFPGFRGRHPHAVVGYHSTQSFQTLESFVEAEARGGYRDYWELVTRDALDPRPARVP